MAVIDHTKSEDNFSREEPMADKKIRLYVGSVAAVAETGESYEFEPFTILTASLEDAAVEARRYVYDRWSVKDGWHDHAATIAPLPLAMYEALSIAALKDLLDLQTPTENQTFFRFKREPEIISRAKSETIH
jgi:hypothetical protein